MEAQKVNREKLEGGSICGVNVFYFCFSLFSPNLIVLSPRTNALIPTVDSISCQGTWQTAHAYTSCGSRILLLPVQPLPFLDARGRPHHIVRRRGVLISPTRHDTTAPNSPTITARGEVAARRGAANSPQPTRKCPSASSKDSLSRQPQPLQNSPRVRGNRISG